VAAARALARRRGVRLYLAGGVVRDLLSRRPVRDVDLVVEADEAGAAAFVRDLARELSASARPHGRFGTAVVTLPDGDRLDVAAARRETYSSPGALPAVAFPAAIDEDLARRDFTVNAMALALSPERRPRLVDPFGGAADLSRRTLRVLHPASFVDDPTRALRAVRYANRYGLRLDAATRRAISRAIDEGAFDRVSGDRLRRELVKVFEEPRRAAAVRLLRRLGIDRAIAPALGRVPREEPLLRRVEALAREGDEPQAGWLAYLLGWAGTLRPADLRAVADRLGLAGSERARLLAWPATRRRLGPGLARRSVSEIARRIGGVSPDERLAASALLSPRDRHALAATHRRVTRRPFTLRGADLIAAGVAPGEAVGRALSRTRDALLDGRIASRDALAFAIRVAARNAAARKVAARNAERKGARGGSA
jgi:tRNA nucleotidyltransferase (CCA-adding enzyme)